MTKTTEPEQPALFPPEVLAATDTSPTRWHPDAPGPRHTPRRPPQTDEEGQP